MELVVPRENIMKSRKYTDRRGKEYIQHYDDDGRETVRSYAETNPYTGCQEVVHYDSDGKKVAASRRKTDWWTEKEYVETDYVSRSTYKDNDGYKMTFGEYLRVGFWIVVIVGVVALILIL